MKNNKHKEKYYFPPFIDSQLNAKGLYWYEYLAIGILAILTFVINLTLTGLVYALVVIIFGFSLCFRLDGRINTLHYLKTVILFILSDKKYKLDLTTKEADNEIKNTPN